jgi:hypothetical protein
MLKFDKAVTCYDELLKIDPNNESAKEGKSVAQGRLSESKSGSRIPPNR